MGKTKGKAAHSDIGAEQQHVVPGLENVIRAEGTTVEPHELALYLAMILPIPFVLMMMRDIPMSVRLLLLSVFIVGVVAMVLTFSRSGWLSCAISIFFATVVILLFWKQGQSLVVFLGLLFAVSLFYPNGYKLVYFKFAEAPKDLLLARYAQMRTALSVWRNNFLFGYGGGNYCLVFDDLDVSVYCSGLYPVHNMYLYFAAELGLCGFVAFYGIVASAFASCWKALRCNDWLIRTFALATMTGLFAAMLDGLTGPLLRSPVAYAQLWTHFGFSVAFFRILKQEGETPAPLTATRNELENSDLR
jgi:O-antigen ligase